MTTPQPPISPDPGNLAPAPAPAPAQYTPSEPPRRKHWWRDAGAGGQIAIVGAVIGMVLVVALAIVWSSGVKLGGGAPDEVTVTVSSCTFTDTPAVTAEFTATNTGDSDQRITIKWEFRDSAGARVDTDTTRVTVPAGDTIHDSETTLLPVTVTSGQCRYAVS